MPITYTNACRYAWKLDSSLAKDLVHDVWLNHYHRTSRNLFDEQEHYVLRAIKWHFYNSLKRFWYKGERIAYEFSGEVEELLADIPTALQQLETREFYEVLTKAIDAIRTKRAVGKGVRCVQTDTEFKTQKECAEKMFPYLNQGTARSGISSSCKSGIPFHGYSFVFSLENIVVSTPLGIETIKTLVELLDKGYTHQEIATELELTPQALDYYSKQLKTIVLQMTNPFHGSTLTPTKRISEAQWNDLTNKNEYELDEYCQNEFKRLYVHKTTKEVIQVTVKETKNKYIK